jgi:hypothetical protein
MYIFLDESGNFTKHNHEEYFVIGSFTVGDQRRTNKEFRKWFRSKFPKRMRKQSEVKWSATGISDDLRLRTLKQIAKLDVRIKYGFLLRSNIPSSYRNKKNKINDGVLYTNIVAEVLEQYVPTDEKEIHVFCDQRNLKGITKQQFISDIRAKLIPHCSPETHIQIEMIDSTSNANIQIADWISGALARYLEQGKNGDEYFKIFKNNFIGKGKEFFKG